MKPLLAVHWREVDVFHDDMPLEPNWAQYLQMEKLKMLYMLTARVEGALVGYLTVFVYPHIHHMNRKSAIVDVLWLHPRWRQGWTGVRLLKNFERGMKTLGASVIWFAVKDHFKNARGRGVGDLLKALGFTKVEEVYGKIIDERRQPPSPS